MIFQAIAQLGAMALRTRTDLYELSDREPPSWAASEAPMRNRSGVPVDENVAMALSAVFCAVEVLSKGIATRDLELFERFPGGRREAARGRHLSRVLLESPNEEMSSFDFLEALMVGVLTSKNGGFAEIEFRRNGDVEAFHLLNPYQVHPDRLPDGRLVYWYPMWDPSAPARAKRLGGRQFFWPHEVLHIRGLTHDGVVGLSRIHHAAQSIGLALALETFGAAYFGNGAAFKGYFTHPSTLSDPAKERLQEEHEAHHGPDAAFREIPVLEEGLRFVRTADDPEKAQANPSRMFQIQEIARWFNVPPHKLKQLVDYKYNSVEGEQRHWVDDSLMPWAVRIEKEINMKCMPPGQPGRYFVKFDFDSLLRASMPDRMEAYGKAIEHSVMSPDECRARENLPPWPGGLGSRFRTPGNFLLIGPDGKVITQGTAAAAHGRAGSAPLKGLEGLLEACFAKAKRRGAHRLQRRQLDGFAEDLSRFLADEITPVIEGYTWVFAGSLAEQDAPGAEKLARDLAAGIAHDFVRATAQAAGSAEALRDLESADLSRSAAWRVREASRLAAAKQEGKRHKALVPCAEHDYEKVAIEQKFSSGHHHPPFGSGCTCTLDF